MIFKIVSKIILDNVDKLVDGANELKEIHEDALLYQLYSQHLGGYRRSSDDTILEIDTKDITTEQFDYIRTEMLKLIGHEKFNDRALAFQKKLHLWDKTNSADAETKLTSLAAFPQSFIALAQKLLPNHRVYRTSSYDNCQNPYRITRVQWIRADKYNPEHVDIMAQATNQGSSQSISTTIYAYDLKGVRENATKPGMSFYDVLHHWSVVPETDELNKIYNEQCDKLDNLLTEIGSVYRGSGIATTEDKTSSWYKRSTKYNFKDTERGLVIHDYHGQNVEESKSRTEFEIKSDTSSLTPGEKVALPYHCYTNCFHLEEHSWMSIHVDSLKRYKFVGKEIQDKLVLPERHKLLVDILLHSSKEDIDDIIEGKKGGSFIMATGIPGTGKTLTAEVFSEIIERSLYKVQCSQLGLDISSVEKNLGKVLGRAVRWNSVLLIDEADVYVRARGEDIHQNAIVGVLLRTLEYYNGILFMTSNVPASIDDAIMSRATAHIKYEIPSKESLKKIFIIQVEQFGLTKDIDEKMIDELVEIFNGIVGRDVKAIIKLTKKYSDNGAVKDKISIEMITQLAEFVPNVNKLMLTQN